MYLVLLILQLALILSPMRGSAKVTAASQVLPPYQVNPVVMSVEYFDDCSCWSESNPTVVVIPNTGRYEVIIRPQFQNNLVGQRFVYLSVNGVPYLLETRNAVGGTFNTIWTSVDIRNYQAGDRLEVRLLQNSGVDLLASATLTIEQR